MCHDDMVMLLREALKAMGPDMPQSNSMCRSYAASAQCQPVQLIDAKALCSKMLHRQPSCILYVQVALQKTCGSQAGDQLIDVWHQQRLHVFDVCGWPAISRAAVEQATISSISERWEVWCSI